MVSLFLFGKLNTTDAALDDLAEFIVLSDELLGELIFANTACDEFP